MTMSRVTTQCSAPMEQSEIQPFRWGVIELVSPEDRKKVRLLKEPDAVDAGLTAYHAVVVVWKNAKDMRNTSATTEERNVPATTEECRAAYQEHYEPQKINCSLGECVEAGRLHFVMNSMEDGIIVNIVQHAVYHAGRLLLGQMTEETAADLAEDLFIGLQQFREQITKKIQGPKEGWEFPVHPEGTCEHGAKWYPCACYDTDGVSLHWMAIESSGEGCREGCIDYASGGIEIEWPFHGTASPHEFEAIGFVVE